MLKRKDEIYEGTPFRFALRNEFPGRHGKLTRLVKDGRVIRHLPGWDERQCIDLKAFTARLSQDGISVPKYDVLRAPRWDRPTKEGTYIVTEAIAGERLDEISRATELDSQLPVSRDFYRRFYAAVDRLIVRLTQNYLDILENGGLIFNAMDQSQFLYGTTRTDRQPALYFVDLDPTYIVVPAMATRKHNLNVNEAKADFEKPISMFFEMKMLHPEADLHESLEATRSYFSRCSRFFQGFYSRAGTPAWARAPNFEYYQAMRSWLLTEKCD